MKSVFLRPVACAIAVAAGWGGRISSAPEQATARGSIAGHVRLAGKSPGNPVIRLGVDPKCGEANAGKRVIQELVVKAPDGGLANVFVWIDGTFPPTPAPSAPVVIDQRACVYGPRVVGAQVGQQLQIRNSDPMLHNVHALSKADNGFNVGQPVAGISYDFRLRDPEVMLHLKCDVHNWMTAYVGVVNHPYFSVSRTDGSISIGNVPTGSYTVRAWQERFGQLSQTVRVRAGAPTAIDFSYTGTEPQPTALRDLPVPAGGMTARLVRLP